MNGKIIPPALDDLIEELTRLPGIGRKTATRLAFHLLKTQDNHAQNLANAIMRMKNRVRFCPVCFNLTENDLCNICSDQTRNKGQICVVEDSESLLMIEKTNQYDGVYHVLGGVISPLDGIGADDLNVKSLLARLEPVEEVILTLNPSTEGEATTIYLARLIKPLHIKVTRLARGIPLGGHLEFVDGLTLSKALESREEI